MNKNLIKAVIYIAVGVFVIYWAETHSPKDLGEVITNEISGSYTMSEPWYYTSLVLGTVVAILGILRGFKAMR